MTTAWWSSSSWSRGQLRPTCSQSPPSERPLIPEENILERSVGSSELVNTRVETGQFSVLPP